MSKQKWATLIYGRSYHLDFRFITIPKDFTNHEIEWVSPYILATTQKARNIANFPRWSLFKNNSYCVIGVTCMVRDLIGKLGENLSTVITKDHLGRPLYVFVGYVTKLNRSQVLDSFPRYMGNDLDGFKSLYQEIEKVWLLRNYDDKKPSLSEYNILSQEIQTIKNMSAVSGQVFQLNNQRKSPEKTFVWRKSTSKNHQLWLEAGRCSYATSLCLNIKEKHLNDSPFLNQTVTDIQKFTIQQLTTNISSNTISDQQQENSHNASLPEKISARAKEDLVLTIKHAVKLTHSGQQLIDNLASLSDANSETTEHFNSSQDQIDEFGFKNKRKPLPSKKQDWF